MESSIIVILTSLFKNFGIVFLGLALYQKFVQIKDMGNLVTYRTKRALSSEEARVYAGDRAWTFYRNTGVIYLVVYIIFLVIFSGMIKIPLIFSIKVDVDKALVIALLLALIPQLFVYLKIENELKQKIISVSR